MINRANGQDELTNSKKSPTREFGERRLAEELHHGDARKVAVALMGEGKLDSHVMRVNACGCPRSLGPDGTSGAESSFQNRVASARLGERSCICWR